MRVQFRATSHCAACGADLTGFVTHRAVVLRRGVRVLSDDPGIIVWGPCPSGCPEWKSIPALDLALTGISEASQVRIDAETAKLGRTG